MTAIVALVSCTKAKRSAPSEARDLYISPLFRGMRSYAERNAERWYILSAEHGVLEPNQIVAPYERTLNTMSKAERLIWWQRVEKRLEVLVSHDAEVIVLAGERYRELLVPFLKGRGCRVDVPLRGLTLGRQLAWLNSARNDGTAS
jgi:cytoplasmic iron level regulating protein YaaA (DUF328/UPF0246 family)